MFQRIAKMSIARVSAKLLFAALLTGTFGMCVAWMPDGDQEDFLKLSSCQFDAENVIYNQTDLLRCLDELTMEIINSQESSRQAWSNSPILSADSDDDPITNDKELTQLYGYQPYNHDLSSYGRPPAHYQTAGVGYLTPQQVLHGGSSFGLFNALTSISRYDDFKCIPRLLCEVAAGVIPSSDAGYTRSTTSSLIQLGRNALAGLFNSFDVTQKFPLLNFAKAAILGYSNRGNSNTCYREYSKCPRDPSDVVEYLNNHNGGFFRLFSGFHNVYKNFLGSEIPEKRDRSEIKFDSNYNNYRTSSMYGKNKNTDGRSVIQLTSQKIENVMAFFPNGNDEQHHRPLRFPTEDNRSKDILKRSPIQSKKNFFPQNDS